MFAALNGDAERYPEKKVIPPASSLKDHGRQISDGLLPSLADTRKAELEMSVFQDGEELSSEQIGPGIESDLRALFMSIDHFGRHLSNSEKLFWYLLLIQFAEESTLTWARDMELAETAGTMRYFEGKVFLSFFFIGVWGLFAYMYVRNDKKELEEQAEKLKHATVSFLKAMLVENFGSFTVGEFISDEELEKELLRWMSRAVTKRYGRAARLFSLKRKSERNEEQSFEREKEQLSERLFIQEGRADVDKDADLSEIVPLLPGSDDDSDADSSTDSNEEDKPPSTISESRVNPENKDANNQPVRAFSAVLNVFLHYSLSYWVCWMPMKLIAAAIGVSGKGEREPLTNDFVAIIQTMFGITVPHYVGIILAFGLPFVIVCLYLALRKGLIAINQHAIEHRAELKLTSDEAVREISRSIILDFARRYPERLSAQMTALRAKGIKLKETSERKEVDVERYKRILTAKKQLGILLPSVINGFFVFLLIQFTLWPVGDFLAEFFNMGAVWSDFNILAFHVETAGNWWGIFAFIVGCLRGFIDYRRTKNLKTTKYEDDQKAVEKNEQRLKDFEILQSENTTLRNAIKGADLTLPKHVDPDYFIKEMKLFEEEKQKPSVWASFKESFEYKRLESACRTRFGKVKIALFVLCLLPIIISPSLQGVLGIFKFLAASVSFIMSLTILPILPALARLSLMPLHALWRFCAWACPPLQKMADYSKQAFEDFFMIILPRFGTGILFMRLWLLGGLIGLLIGVGGVKDAGVMIVMGAFGVVWAGLKLFEMRRIERPKAEARGFVETLSTRMDFLRQENNEMRESLNALKTGDADPYPQHELEKYEPLDFREAVENGPLSKKLASFSFMHEVRTTLESPRPAGDDEEVEMAGRGDSHDGSPAESEALLAAAVPS